MYGISLSQKLASNQKVHANIPMDRLNKKQNWSNQSFWTAERRERPRTRICQSAGFPLTIVSNVFEKGEGGRSTSWRLASAKKKSELLRTSVPSDTRQRDTVVANW